jgi:tetratricopeptide (TPR) repeat protein
MNIRTKIFGGFAVAVMVLSLFSSRGYAASPEKDIIKNGIELSKQGKDDEAISEFNKAISIKPNSAEAYYNRGLAYCKR